MVLVSTGGQARLIWYPFRTHDFNKYVNTSHNLVTAAWHDGTLTMPSSRFGLRISAGTTGCIRKESQVPWQLSVVYSSMLLVSTGGQARLSCHPFRAFDFNSCMNTIWSLPRAKQVFCQPPARGVSYESTHQLQVESGRKAKSHDS